MAYSPLFSSSSKRLNNLYATSFIASALQLFNQYKASIITFLLLFVTFDFLVHGPNSILGGKLHDLSNSNYLTNSQFTNFTTFVRASNHYYPVNVASRNVKKTANIENRLLHFFPYDEYANAEKNVIKLNNPQVTIPNHFYDNWKVFREQDNLALIEMDDKEMVKKFSEFLKPTVPEVFEAFEALPTHLQYEFGKYLAAYFYGGLSFDENSIIIRPFRDWYFSRIFETKLIVGISVDDNEDDWYNFYNRRMKFSNKCFYAKRHHPFLAKLISKITFLVHTHKDELAKADWRQINKKVDSAGEPLDLSITGESIFTDTLFEYFNSLKDSIYYTYSNVDKDGRPTENLDRLGDTEISGPPVNPNDRYTYKTFTKLHYPNVIDDTVILPRVSFYGEAKDTLSTETDRAFGSLEGMSLFYYGRFDLDSAVRV